MKRWLIVSVGVVAALAIIVGTAMAATLFNNPTSGSQGRRPALVVLLVTLARGTARLGKDARLGLDVRRNAEKRGRIPH